MVSALSSSRTALSSHAARSGSARYHAALDYLFARTTGAYKFGLERTEELLRLLGDPHRRFPALHVAGTNGKGSSVATAEALLRGKGLRVGKYTSPHLVDFRERIVVDGRCISEEEVVAFVERWTPTVESLGATFFEATTALAFAHFAEARVEVALVETGLGGRLDATNVVDPIVAGVTTIDYDHTEYLGDTLEKIAAEKAGIYKRHRPAVVGERDARLREILAGHAQAAGAAPVHVVALETQIDDVVVAAAGTTFTLTLGNAKRSLHTPLSGLHQADNTAFALVLLDAAGVAYSCSLDEAARSLSSVAVPGRFQQVGDCIFDVAHNVEGAAVLAETLRTVDPTRPLTAVFAVLADKDWRRMMRVLAQAVDRFILTTAPSAPQNRTWDLDAAKEFADAQRIAADVARNFDDALARAMSSDGTTLITGSFHTVGDAMARLQLSPVCG